MEQTRIDLSMVYYDVVKPKPHIPRPLRIMDSITDNPLYNSVGIFVRDDFFDFHYVLSGTGEVCYNNRTYQVGPGQGFLWHKNFPNFSYRYPEGKKEPWRFISLCFSQEDLMPTVENIINNAPIFNIPQNVHIIKLLIKNLSTRNRIVISCAEGANIVYELLVTLMRYSGNSEATEFHPIIDKAETLIASKLNSNISVSEIAQELDISREYLSRIFHEYKGITLKEYIKTARVQFACKYLLTTDKSINEIAELLNYTAASNFTRDFTHIMGITPGYYRRRKKYSFIETKIP